MMAAMSPPTNQDELRLAVVADELATAVEAALPGWVERTVAHLVEAYGGQLEDAVAVAAADAGRRAADEIGAALRALLGTDVDAQATNPLSVLRGAVRYPAAVLREAGVPPVVRDQFAERAFPNDAYDLTPATWSDIDPSLHEPGLRWGAAKAHVVLARRTSEGKR